MEDDSKQTCGRCTQVDELLCLVAELWEEMGRLRSISESEKGIDQWSCALPSLVLTRQLSMATTEVGPVPVLCQDEGSITRSKEEWKQVTAWSCKRSPSLPSQLPLQNRYEALGMIDEGHDEIEDKESVQVFSLRSDQPTLHVKTCTKTSTEKKQQ